MLNKDLFEKIVEYINENNDGAIEGNRNFIFTNDEKFMLAPAKDKRNLELYNMNTCEYYDLNRESIVDNLYKMFDIDNKQ